MGRDADPIDTNRCVKEGVIVMDQARKRAPSQPFVSFPNRRRVPGRYVEASAILGAALPVWF